MIERKNTICKQCQQLYHNCTSCSDFSEFCSNDCLKKYKATNAYMIVRFWDSLNDKQRTALTNIFDDDIFLDYLIGLGQ